MARVAIALTCSAEQRAELTARPTVARRRPAWWNGPKIVLGCLEGKCNDAVGRELGMRPNTVGVWRGGYAAAGSAHRNAAADVLGRQL